MKKRPCKNCQKPVPEEKRAGTEFCDDTCRSQFWRRENLESKSKSIKKPDALTKENEVEPEEELSNSLRGVVQNTDEAASPEIVQFDQPTEKKTDKEPTLDELIAQATQKRNTLDQQQKRIATQIQDCETELKMVKGEYVSGRISKYLLQSPQEKSVARNTIEKKRALLKKEQQIILNEWAQAFFQFCELSKQKVQPSTSPEIKPVQVEKKEVVEQPQEKKNVSLSQNSGKVISSKDLKKIIYQLLNFSGKWFDFIGKPSVVFHAVVHGKPGEGKSTYCFQMAHYLAENFGKVIYISGEEGFSKTLQDKLVNNNAESPFLSFADLRSIDEIKNEIPTNEYNFIFIDSLDTLKIDAARLKELREHYKNSAFVTISQSTKDGKMRGSQEIVHDSDIEIRVENGIAITIKNRFKKTGKTYQIFSDEGATQKEEKPIEPPRNVV